MTQACPACGTAVDTTEAEPLARVACPRCGEKMRVERTFDHFVLLDMLRLGGMGTVYKARDTLLDRLVALKLLRKDLVGDKDHTSRLREEARVAASVNHPNVIQVFSSGTDNGQFYVGMELVDHGTRDDLIEKRNRLSEEQVLESGIQVANGLRAAYRQGLIHRDVKPANILFVDEQTAKISDFGLAGAATRESKKREEIWGTPYYVAPERLNNEPEDFRSDIYSLGATLFHAVAGRPPFDGETTSASDLRTLKNNPLKLKDVAPEVSRPTANAIARMIAPDPSLRFASHDALILTLKKSERMLRGEPEPWRVKAALFIAAVALLGLIAFGWFFFARPRAPAKATASASARPGSDI